MRVASFAPPCAGPHRQATPAAIAAKGLVPDHAKIGNGIAIHGTRPQEEWTVDNFYNWTDGCISLKYSEMQDLYSYIPQGTEVTIQQ